MRPWVRQALMLGTVLLLALPPGWCRVLPRFGGAVASPEAVRSCCGHQTPASTPHCPATGQDGRAAVSCCCPTDTTRPPTPEVPPADLISTQLHLGKGEAPRVRACS